MDGMIDTVKAHYSGDAGSNVADRVQALLETLGPGLISPERLSLARREDGAALGRRRVADDREGFQEDDRLPGPVDAGVSAGKKICCLSAGGGVQ